VLNIVVVGVVWRWIYSPARGPLHQILIFIPGMIGDALQG